MKIVCEKDKLLKCINELCSILYCSICVKKEDPAQQGLQNFLFLIHLYSYQNNPGYKQSVFPYHLNLKSNHKANQSNLSDDEV